MQSKVLLVHLVLACLFVAANTAKVQYTYESKPEDAAWKDIDSGDIVRYENTTTYIKYRVTSDDGKVKSVEWGVKNSLDKAVRKIAAEPQQVIIENGKKAFTLEIKRVNQLFTGDFTANVTKEGSEEPERLNWKVHAKPYVDMSGKAASVNEKLGGTAVLSCTVIGVPLAVVKWKKNGVIMTVPTKEDYDKNKPVDSTPEEGKDADFRATEQRSYTDEFEGTPGARLVINDLKYPDRDNYTCLADNTENNNGEAPFETDEAWIQVRVKDPLAPLYPFIGIVLELLILAVIIFACERHKRIEDAKGDAAGTANSGERNTMLSASSNVRQRNV